MSDFDDFTSHDDPFSKPAAAATASSDFDDFLVAPVKSLPSLVYPQQSIPSAALAAPVSVPPALPVFEETAYTKWQTEHRAVLQKKMAAASQAKRDLQEFARNELENHYAERRAKVEKNKVANREEEKAYKEETTAILASGGDWEKVARYCDLGPPKSKEITDTSRMRSLLIDLKNEKPANKAKPLADLF